MDSQSLLRIEEASMQAWPALEELQYDGWVLRFAKGYTRRSNSITPLYGGEREALEKLKYCQDAYRSRQLPCVFRLNSFNERAHHARLFELLHSQGFVKHSGAKVLHCILAHRTDGSSDHEIRAVPLDEFFSAYCDLHNYRPEQQQVHRQLLEKIHLPCLRLVLYEAERAMACGLAVIEAPHAGIFDVVSRLTERRKGYGERLMRGLLAQSKRAGALESYLQVAVENEAAQRLYSKLSYREAYEYWYCVDGQSPKS